jgi:hypothetical protein
MFSDFQKYQSPTAAGVLLPKIKIEDKYYKMLSAPNSISNYDFLRRLAFKGVKDKKIDSFENKLYLHVLFSAINSTFITVFKVLQTRSLI